MLYYNSGQEECQLCSPYCLNCINTSDNCLSCKKDRYLQGSTCLCQNKLSGALISTYEILGNPVCLSCHYSCLNCNGSTQTNVPHVWIVKLDIYKIPVVFALLIIMILENQNVQNVIIHVKLVPVQILYVQLVIHLVLELLLIKNVFAKMDILMMEPTPFVKNAIILVNAVYFQLNAIHVV